MPEIPCSTCRRRAVVYQRYSGLHLCKNHFILDFEAKAKRAIRSHRWIVSGDRIGILLGGGSGQALLYFLRRLAGNRRDLQLFPITIDEGSPGVRDPPGTDGLGGGHIAVSFRHMFGVTMDEIIRERREVAPGVYRDVFLRRSLDTVAKDHDITKIALGTSLDAGAQMVLMTMVQGNAEQLMVPPSVRDGRIPRIRPFMTIPAREVLLYAILQTGTLAGGLYPPPCTALERDVAALLDEYAWRHPSAKHALVNMGEDIASCAGVPHPAVSPCPTCGEPQSGECRVCRLLEGLLHDH